MDTLKAFPLADWISEHRHLLKPPVGNKQIFENDEFIFMAVVGLISPRHYNYRKGPERCYQHEGEMELKTTQEGKPVDIPIRAGEMLLLPGLVPHSPVRFPDSVGIVVERRRQPGDLDGLLWLCETCHGKLFVVYFLLLNNGKYFIHIYERDKYIAPI